MSEDKLEEVLPTNQSLALALFNTKDEAEFMDLLDNMLIYYKCDISVQLISQVFSGLETHPFPDLDFAVKLLKGLGDTSTKRGNEAREEIIKATGL